MKSDVVTAFLRIYQGGSDKLGPVSMKMQILDAAGKSVFDKADTLAPDRFSAERAADYQLRLPLAQLAPGEYLLTFAAGTSKATARRDTQFQVR